MGKSKRKKPLVRPKDNNKRVHKEIWWAHMNTVKKLWIPQKGGKYLDQLGDSQLLEDCSP
jgi:hypothetical protein